MKFKKDFVTACLFEDRITPLKDDLHLLNFLNYSFKRIAASENLNKLNNCFRVSKKDFVSALGLNPQNYDSKIIVDSLIQLSGHHYINRIKNDNEEVVGKQFVKFFSLVEWKENEDYVSFVVSSLKNLVFFDYFVKMLDSQR